MKNTILTIVSIAALVGCKDTPASADYSLQTPVDLTTQRDGKVHPGKKLMETQCYVCHNPSTGENGRIAPPMVAVKSHYKTGNITKDDFKDAIWEFVKKPNPHKAKMNGAVKRFGLMPYQKFDEKEIKQIADYIYDNKIDEPTWFKEHIENESNGKVQYRNDGKTYEQPKGTAGAQNSEGSSKSTPADRGLEYAMSTKKELGKNLMGAIQRKGTKEAVVFCNKQAYPITDSMAIAHNATIKRVSDKPRNPKNQASKEELDIITVFKKAVANDSGYEPITIVQNSSTQFYYPITTNSMCLQCHGTPQKDIPRDVLQTINKLYPADEATGYNVNEVRGLWSITFVNQ